MTTQARSDGTGPSSSEWGSERLDVDAYLARVGYHGDRTATVRTLRGLHRAHVTTIPFENLDIVLDRTINLDMDSLQGKFVHHRRGGYCYEHNLLFAAALDRLGYRVTRLVGRVHPEKPGPRTHMLLAVEAGGGEWLADVGFGGGPLEPLPLRDAATSHQGRWAHRLEWDGRAWMLRFLGPDQSSTLYAFTTEPHRFVDYVVYNYYTATSPDSPFTGRAVAHLRGERDRRTLVGHQLSTVYLDGTTEHRTVASSQLPDVLRTTFNIALAPEEAAHLHSVARGREPAGGPGEEPANPAGNRQDDRLGVAGDTP